MLVISGATSGRRPAGRAEPRSSSCSSRSIGSTMGTRDELDRLVRLCVERDVRPVIEAEIPLADARAAFEALAARRGLRQARADALRRARGRRRDLPRLLAPPGRRSRILRNAAGQTAPVHPVNTSAIRCASRRAACAARDMERGRARSRSTRAGGGRSRRSGRTSSPAGGDGSHRAAMARGAGDAGFSVHSARAALPPGQVAPPAARADRGARRAGGAARARRRAVARARAVLPARRRDRGHQPPLPHRPRARAGEDPHPRGGRGPPGRRLRPAGAVRRPQHAAPRVPGRPAADLRPRHERPPARGARRALGPRRARPDPRPRLDRRVPRAARLRGARGVVDVHRRPRRLAARPRARDGLEVLASAYAHDWRRAGLSDHSALVADLRSTRRVPSGGSSAT